jgi:hypothetical protein
MGAHGESRLFLLPPYLCEAILFVFYPVTKVVPIVVLIPTLELRHFHFAAVPVKLGGL